MAHVSTTTWQPGLIAPDIADAFSDAAEAVLLEGDCLQTLRTVPDATVKLIVTSPPYNLGKVYETAAQLDQYLAALSPIVDQLIRVLSPRGSVCWQVGNYVEDSEIFPLDIFYYPFFKKHGLKLRNRIIWHFAHGLHASKRFSGRYEVLLWFTKDDTYTFNLGNVRIPSKYRGKRHFKGEKRGLPPGNTQDNAPSEALRIMFREHGVIAA